MQRGDRKLRRTIALTAGAAGATLLLASAIAANAPHSQWWAPGSGRPLPAYVDYTDPTGRFGLVNASGAIRAAQQLGGGTPTFPSLALTPAAFSGRKAFS